MNTSNNPAQAALSASLGTSLATSLASSLATLTPGFADPVHDTQAVFRILLDVLSRPGTIGTVRNVLPALSATAATGPHQPAAADRAAFAALLTLCDFSTPVWLAQADTSLASALRFHTGAPLVDTPQRAAFAYVHDTAALPALEHFAPGDPESPETSATLLVRVASLTSGRPLTLRGPGIESTHRIALDGLPEHFWLERAELAPLFPCGIDCYFVCGDALMGLPRTTQVELN